MITGRVRGTTEVFSTQSPEGFQDSGCVFANSAVLSQSCFSSFFLMFFPGCTAGGAFFLLYVLISTRLVNPGALLAMKSENVQMNSRWLQAMLHTCSPGEVVYIWEQFEAAQLVLISRNATVAIKGALQEIRRANYKPCHCWPQFSDSLLDPTSLWRAQSELL